MKKLFYIDKRGDYHSFQMKEETLEGILKEYITVEEYLKSIGVSFVICGVGNKRDILKKGVSI